jgi:hypothetical protein
MPPRAPHAGARRNSAPRRQFEANPSCFGTCNIQVLWSLGGLWPTRQHITSGKVSHRAADVALAGTMDLLCSCCTWTWTWMSPSIVRTQIVGNSMLICTLAGIGIHNQNLDSRSILTSRPHHPYATIELGSSYPWDLRARRPPGFDFKRKFTDTRRRRPGNREYLSGEFKSRHSGRDSDHRQGVVYMYLRDRCALDLSKFVRFTYSTCLD